MDPNEIGSKSKPEFLRNVTKEKNKENDFLKEELLDLSLYLSVTRRAKIG